MQELEDLNRTLEEAIAAKNAEIQSLLFDSKIMDKHRLEKVSLDCILEFL